MYAIVCVDNRMGMLFNHRRQSRDRVLNDYLLSLTEGRRLLMNSFSGKLFGPSEQIHISETFLEDAREHDFCFVEDRPLLPFAHKLEALILCRWNRDYPGDFFLDLDLSCWHLSRQTEFPGSSHEKLTIEVYVK